MKNIIKKLSAVLLSVAVVLLVPGVALSAQAATMTSQAGLVSTASGALNVRASAGTGSAILTALPKGSYITLIAKSGDWWQVEYASGSYGYVSAGYITPVSGSAGAKVSVASGNLNVRSGPGATYSVKTVLPAGKIVVTLSSSGGWSKILYSGAQVGYVSSQYLKTSSMIWPVPASAKINQYFVSGSHLGIDIGSSVHGVSGDRVAAAYDGQVVFSGTLSGYGYVAYVNSYYNGQYIQTRYAHLASAPSVKAGDTVAAGQTIGYMGNTGTSSGVHLHFEVRIRANSGACIANADSTPVNPLNYVSY